MATLARTAVLAVTTLALAPALAQATPSETAPDGSVAAAADRTEGPRLDSRWTDRPTILNVHILAFGAPAGEFAVELEHNLSNYFSASVATGVAVGGPQVATMLRLRSPIGPIAGGFGAGLSYGDYKEWFPLFDEPDRQEHVLWANGEIYAEARSRGGFSVRAYLGVSKEVAAGRCLGDDGCDGITLPTKLPYVGTAFGTAF